MNDEEKAYLPILREVIASMGLKDKNISEEFWCGEAWRYHVELKDAKKFFAGKLMEKYAESAYRAPPVTKTVPEVKTPPPPPPPTVFKAPKVRRKRK